MVASRIAGPLPWPGWFTLHRALPALIAPFGFVLMYALITLLYDLSVVFSTLNGALEDQAIRVEPLHPDGAGGLGAIGRFVANFGPLVAAFGLALSVHFAQDPGNAIQDYALIAMVVLYIPLSSLIFFIPLWTAHSKMVEHRRGRAAGISAEYDEVLSRLWDLRSADPDSIAPVLRKLSQLREMHNISKEYPLWPFSTASAQRYFGLALSSLLPSVIAPVVELLGTIL